MPGHVPGGEDLPPSLRGRTAYPKPMADTLRDVFLHEGTFSYAAFFSIIKGLPKGKEQSYEHRTHQGHPPRAGPGRGRAPFYPRPSCRPPRTRCNIWPATQPSALPATRPRPARWRTIRPSCRSYGTSRMILKKTAVIAGDWFRVMQENWPSPRRRGVSSAEIDGAEYLAALKLNYKPGWLHYCAAWTAGPPS